MKQLENNQHTPFNPFNPMDARHGQTNERIKKVHRFGYKPTSSISPKPKAYSYVVDWQIDDEEGHDE